MATAKEWLDLASRIEAANGPDPRLDCEIISLLGLRWPGLVHWFNVTRRKEADFTGSIDAAVALIGMVLPGWFIMSVWNGEASVCDVHTKPVGDASGRWPAHAKAASEALARSAAFCRAMAAKEARNGNV